MKAKFKDFISKLSDTEIEKLLYDFRVFIDEYREMLIIEQANRVVSYSSFEPEESDFITDEQNEFEETPLLDFMTTARIMEDISLLSAEDTLATLNGLKNLKEQVSVSQLDFEIICFKIEACEAHLGELAEQADMNSQRKTLVCHICGVEVDTGAFFCDNCGNRL
ncbi:MAG: hypothetical protein GX802_06110 [Clostridiales bacterium]|jgi:hypothetical protein|nr:hypothetical protein [Clostridiales bacterium]